MATEKGRSWQYLGTVALKKGTMMAMSTVANQLVVATAVTDVPAGILLEDVPAASATAPANVGIGSTEGEVYKVIGSTTIAIKAALGPTTGGKAVTITLTTTYAQEWIWGIALTAAGSGGTDIVEMRYGPQIAS
jgi:hypothetical protein